MMDSVFLVASRVAGLRSKARIAGPVCLSCRSGCLVLTCGAMS